MNLKNIREKLGYTQEELADKLKISRQTFMGYESGAKEIPSKILINLSKILNTSIDSILGTNFSFIENDSFTEFRDFLYIDDRKVLSYMNSLGLANISTVTNRIKRSGNIQGNFEISAGPLPLKLPSVELERAKTQEQEFTESKSIEYYTNQLIEILNRKNIIMNFDQKSTDKIFKTKLRITKNDINEVINRLFNLFNYADLFQATLKDYDDETKAAINVFKNIFDNNNNIKLIGKNETNIFYADLNKNYIKIQEDIFASEIDVQVIFKLREKIEKSDKPTLDLGPFSNILPPNAISDLVDKVKSFGGQNVHTFYEQGAFIIEVLCVYQ